MVNTDADGNELHIDDSGTVRRLGLIPADMHAMRARPQYADAFPTLLESTWPKKSAGLRAFMPWVEFQQHNDCGGHGSSATMAAAWNYSFAETAPMRRFSPDFLYGLTNGGRDNGSTPHDLHDALMSKGCCLASTVPEGSIYASRYPAAAYTEAARFKPAQALVIQTFEDIASGAARLHAIFSGIFIGNRFRPDSNGIMPEYDGSEVGGHCTAQIGELEYIEGRGWGIWTLNSWSKDWGKDGWAWLPRSYFDGGLPAFAAVAIVSCTPDPEDPTKTPTPNT